MTRGNGNILYFVGTMNVCVYMLVKAYSVVHFCLCVLLRSVTLTKASNMMYFLFNALKNPCLALGLPWE